MCRKHTCLMSLWSACWLLSAAILIVGIVIVGVVNNAINSAVSKAVKIDPNSGSATDWQNYLNGSSTVDFYVWNITNLNAVLTTGAVPIVQEIGPVHFNHWTLKSNYSFSSDGTLFTYNNMDTYEVLDSNSQYILNQPIYTVNIGYLALMSLVGNTFDLGTAQAINHTTNSYGFINGQWFPEGAPTLDDTNAAAYINGNVLAGVYGVLSVSSSALYTNLRGISVPIYMGAVLNQLVSTLAPLFYGGNTQIATGAIIAQWANSTGKALYYTLNQPTTTPLKGFELASPLSSVQVASQLWNSTNPYSLISGIANWAGLANPATLYTTAGLIQRNIPGMTANDLNIVGQWITALTTFGNPYYEIVCMAAYSASMASLYPFIYNSTQPSDFTLKKWSDLGALQFGTSIVPTWISDLTAGKTAATAKQVPVSYTTSSLFAPSFAANGITNPFEFAAVNALFNPLYSSNPNNVPRLSLSNATVLFQTLAGGGTVSSAVVIYKFLYQVLQSICPTPSAANLFCSQSLATGVAWGPSFAFVLSQKPALQPYLSALGPLFYVPKVGQMIYFYVNAYFGYSVTGTPSSIDAGGITNTNSGLFVRKTVAEIMFGFTFFGNAVPGVVCSWNQLIPSNYNPTQFYTTYASSTLSPSQQQAQQYSASQGQQYSLYTGQDTTSNVGHIFKYAGFNGFQFACDYLDPGRYYKCSNPAGVVANNAMIWGGYENVTGTSTGNLPPFKEGDSNIIQNLTLYVTQMKRNVLFSYNYSYSYKGVNVRRYNLDPSTYSNYIPGPLCNNSMRNDYHYFTNGELDGIIPVITSNGGLPLVASLPHFYRADSSKMGVYYYTGSSAVPPSSNFYPDPLLHDSWLDVEPLTGKAMYGHKRLMALIKLTQSHYPFNGIYNKLFTSQPNIYMPYYWADDFGSISDSQANTFVSSIYNTRTTASTIQAVLVAVGVIGILSFLALCCFQYRRNKAENTVTAYATNS